HRQRQVVRGADATDHRHHHERGGDQGVDQPFAGVRGLAGGRVLAGHGHHLDMVRIAYQYWIVIRTTGAPTMDRRTRHPRPRRALGGTLPGGRRAWLAVVSTGIALGAVLLLALRDAAGDETAPPPPTLAVRAVAPEPRTWPSTLPAVGSI